MSTPQSQRHLSELAVIGGVLARHNRPYLAGDVLSVCSPDCFIHSDTRAVAEAMRTLVGQDRAVDIVSLAAVIGTGLREVGGIGRLGEIAADYGFTLLTERNVLAEAERLQGERRKDNVQTELAAITRQVQTDGVPVEVIAEELRKTALALEGGAGGASVTLDQQLDEYVAALDAPERKARPVPTPWYGLNRILRGGILPGELAILAARPSVGKSAFALNLAHSVACSGQKTLFFSLEMSRQQLLDRLVANRGGINLGSFREGLTPDEIETARRTADNLRGVALMIYDDTRVTVGEVRRRTRIAQRGKQPVGLVVVDYLQLMTPQDRHSSREREVAEMSRSLKLLAKDLGVPVVLLAQLNRKSEEGKRPPMLSDLRESGAIEQDADIVMFLHQARPVYGNPDEPVQVIVAKGRSSGVGTEYLNFKRVYQRFTDSTAQAYVTAAEEEEREVIRHLEIEQAGLM